MKPFLLVGTRAEDAAADAELEAVRRFAGLGPQDLVRVRLEAGPMPDLDLDALSGVILGGSPYCASDPPQEKSPTQVRVEREMSTLLDRVTAAGVPFLGACYGVGTLGVHAGGVVDRTYGEPVGAVEVRLTDAGRADPVLGALPPTFTAFVGHKEAVRVLPPGATLLATSDACPVQAFRVGEHLYATQFHPELDARGLIDRATVYRDAGYFPTDELDAVVRRAREAVVTEPGRVLGAFVERYAR
ncbi:glutamine amidotransferase [Cellulomonas bogoriensis]|uniref:Glutamine amidotransferase n=1 Tax=Cellulomonas bogoriensis 69B4 = DSM 16987 TaxID=1386082 RepID=A0A0A0C0G7_9CELL|nr:glutamine amidotransferase [Cellulomonas bogoriensis]KGM13442.1 glutamine amidotransferase [Cellulomonas bogoriensis 69B4 = DSM 16987]